MGKKWLVTCSVVLVYIFTSGLILAFAQGYTVDFKTQKVVTTGVLEVSTFPSGATVTFGDELLRDTTPVSITHNTPGNYYITLNLDGYESVKIPAQIQAQLVTRFQEIPFWPEAKSWLEIELSDRILSLSALPETGFVMVHLAQELSWWNMQNNNLVKVLSLPITPREFGLCSEDDTVCLVIGDERTILVDLIDKDYLLLDTVLNSSEVVKIFPFQSEYYILNKAEANLELHKITQIGNVLQQMTISDISAFDLQDQELWYVQNGYIYRRSLISGIIQQVAKTNGQTIDRLLVTTQYIAWHGVNGEVVLWNRATEMVENTWQKAKVFFENDELLVVSEAKIWHVGKTGIHFIGQAPSEISFAHIYTQYAWLADMENGDNLLIMLSPLGMYSIHAQSLLSAVLPYQLVARANGNILKYHLYPHPSWLQF